MARWDHGPICERRVGRSCLYTRAAHLSPARMRWTERSAPSIQAPTARGQHGPCKFLQNSVVSSSSSAEILWIVVYIHPKLFKDYDRQPDLA